MKNYHFNETALFMLLVITSLLLAGCVVSDSSVRYSGVENSQLRQIKHGITTKDQLVEMVGEPTEQSTTVGGAEIFKYKCTTIKDNQFVLFPPPIIIDDTKETEHTVVFKIRDGIVRRHWKEKIKSN
jgi:outer membrane protein assembly factor BamE (lipoprotein component of BamABCDE complex)